MRETHLYQVGGEPVPSVTEVLGLARISDPEKDFEGIPPHILQNAADRGTMVHALTELVDDKIFDWDMVPEDCVGFLDGYHEFLKDYKIEQIHSEAVVVSQQWRFAGTLDRAWRIDGRPSVTDIKTPVDFVSHWGVQTAGYMIALQEGSTVSPLELRGLAFPDRHILQLRKDGTYKLILCDDPNDIPDFQAAARLATRKVRIGQWTRKENQ